MSSDPGSVWDGTFKVIYGRAGASRRFSVAGDIASSWAAISSELGQLMFDGINYLPDEGGAYQITSPGASLGEECSNVVV